MNELANIYRGKSLSVGFTIPAAYDESRIEDLKVNIGTKVYQHTIVQGVIGVNLTSNDTAKMVGRQDVVLTIEDSLFGVQKINCGYIYVSSTISKFQSESYSSVYDVMIMLSFYDNSLDVDHVLFDYLKGKSAYEYAVEGGYLGTEEQFYLDLAKAAIAVPYTGADKDVDLGANGITVDNVTFNQTPESVIAPLKLQYNDDEKTLEFGLADGGKLQIGKEMFEEYTNIDTVPLTNGMIVSTAAIPGNRKGIKRTDFTNLTSIRSIVGMVTVDSIGINQSGRVTTKGIINDLNTNGWAEGLQLWGNPAVLGGWSGSKPAKPQYAVQIGQVVVASATVGSVELNVAKDVKFSDLADVNGSTNLIDNADTIPKRDADGIIREITVADIKADFKADTDALYEPILGFTPEDTANKGQPNGYASLDGDGLVPVGQLPSFVDDIVDAYGTYTDVSDPTAIIELWTDATHTVAVDKYTGKIYVDVVTRFQFRWSGSVWGAILSGPVQSVAGKTGNVLLNKSDVGLGNVDNTSDANKPVSTLQAAAIATKVGLTGNETVAGVKTFSSSPIVPNPTASGQALNKGAADGTYVALTGAQNVAGVKTFTDKPIVPTPTVATEAANKGYVDSAVVGAMPAASLSLLPQLAYKTRVDADSGLIKDLEKLTKLYIDVLELNKTAEVLFDGRSGYKLTTGKLSKLYNMAKAVDYTAGAGAEFYIGGLIAPNEGFKIKGLTGETGTKAVTGTAKAYLATESWTAGVMVLFNKLSATAQRIYLSAADYLLISSTTVSWVNAGGTVLTCTHSLKVGINNYIEFQYNNGLGLIKVNGVAITTITTAQAVSVDRIQLNQTTYNFDGVISHFILLTGRISESASQQYYSFIRSLIPEIEGIAIGNQYWQTSNYEGVVAGDGTAIPEVQDPAVWATSTTIYNDTYAATSGTAAQKELAALKAAAMWCYYNNDVNNGTIYGKLLNDYAKALVALYPPTGYRVPSVSDFNQLVAALGGSSVAGGKLKKDGLDYWETPNAGATNESGFSAIAGGLRNADGSFLNIKGESRLWASNVGTIIYLVKNTAASTVPSGQDRARGMSLRFLRNSPVGPNERTITSTTIVSDIASTANSTQIPFGYSVASIRLKTTANLTNIKVELWNNFYSGTPTLVATLITGKTANNTTMVFPVLADVPSLLQDGTLRITASHTPSYVAGTETIVEYNLQKNTF